MPTQLRNMELMLKVTERAAVMALHEAPSIVGRRGDGPDCKCESKIMNALTSFCSLSYLCVNYITSVDVQHQAYQNK